ncbi:MAG: site-specific DNA-methyltransferase [Nitrososphaerales archaeon]|nr:site-specific DNA-methyltransferase [Nitrososphaerales archaeon]
MVSKSVSEPMPPTEKGKHVYCKIIYGDSREVLPTLSEKASLIVTSPPYADARKSHYDSIAPGDYANWFAGPEGFHEAFWNALDPEGSFVLNIKDKVVSGTRNRYVWKTIERLEEKGWKSIDDYLWRKTNPMPGYWHNRLRDGWEYCFHLAKTTRPKMYQEQVKIPIGGWTEARLANLRGKDLKRQNSANRSGFGRDLTYWVNKDKVLPSNVIETEEPEEAENVIDLPIGIGRDFKHPAVYPVGLPAFFIRLFTRQDKEGFSDDLVIDPFGGSGTTGIAAINLHRNSILIDNNKEFCDIAYKRIEKESNLNGTKVIKEGF